MVRNGVLDLVKVGDLYQVAHPEVICLPDLSDDKKRGIVASYTTRERAKQTRDDYIRFNTGPSLTPPMVREEEVRRSKYVLQPRSVLVAATRMEKQGRDTALSHALGVAAGYKLMELGENPMDIINPIYGKTEKKKAQWWDKPPEDPPWDNYCSKPNLKNSTLEEEGWFWHRDGYWMKPTFSHPDDGYIHKIHIGKTVKPSPKYMDAMEERRYNAYVKGEVVCG